MNDEDAVRVCARWGVAAAPVRRWAGGVGVGVCAVVLAACGTDKISPDVIGATPNISPGACSVLTEGVLAAALAPPVPASPAVPGPGTPTPGVLATPRGGLASVGSKDASQCTYTSPDGARLVVTVVPKTTLAALRLGAGSNLGPAFVQSGDAATLMAVPKSGSVVEIVLVLSGVSNNDRVNRLAPLASAVAAAPVPTVAASAGPVAQATSSTASAPAVPGQKVSGQTAAQTVSEGDQLKFIPDTTTLTAGQVVEWKNTGKVAHNVTFDDYPEITSATMNGNDAYQLKFTQAGAYQYHCTFHPGMNGTITVA